MSSRKKRTAAVVIILNDCGALTRKNKKTVWVKKWLLERHRFTHMNLLNFIKCDSPLDYKNCLRVTNESFNYLLEKVRPLITKTNTVMRAAIPTEAHLDATLKFLATGMSFEALKFETIISPQALGQIIPDTCKAIYTALQPEYLKFPTSSEEWLNIAKDYESLWNFPNCGGSLDGKHIAIVKPADEGSYFFNYKGYHSIVLLGLVDANLQFIMADIGCNGRISDGGVIKDTLFNRKMKKNELNLPKNNETVGNKNFVFIADEAFALSTNILKPFPRKELTYEKRIFNYRLSRARRCVESAFGVPAARFRIFQTTINLKPSKVDAIVMACVVLHNFLRKLNRRVYTPPSMLDRENVEDGSIQEGDWRKVQPHRHYDALRSARTVKPPTEASENRDDYVTYFNGPGKLPFQDQIVHKN